MTSSRDLERRLAEHFHGEAPSRAPDWVLQSALTTIDTTPQQRGLTALRRNLDMPNYARLAAAAVVVIAVGAFALWQLAPPGPGGPSIPAPTPSSVPTPSAEPTAEPTASAVVAPALTETFTSAIHGISISYPDGWRPQAATEAWASGAELPWSIAATGADFIVDPTWGEGGLFLGVASQPLGDESGIGWVDRQLAIPDPEPCVETEPVEVDGAQGRLATCDEPLRAFVTDGQRGYAIFLYRSDDAPQDVYGLEFLNDLLESVQLRPGDAAAAVRTSG
jgi:hypothetical protein